jgi:hypothetical protein
LTYAEIFDVSNGEIIIRVQKQMATGSILEIGPITNNPDNRVEYLKNKLDDAFLLKGL